MYDSIAGSVTSSEESGLQGADEGDDGRADEAPHPRPSPARDQVGPKRPEDSVDTWIGDDGGD